MIDDIYLIYFIAAMFCLGVATMLAFIWTALRELWRNVTGRYDQV